MSPDTNFLIGKKLTCFLQKDLLEKLETLYPGRLIKIVQEDDTPITEGLGKQLKLYLNSDNVITDIVTVDNIV